MEYCILEPIAFLTQVVSTNVYAEIGQSGGFCTTFRRRIIPENVSFANLQIIELPRVATDATGYYLQPSKEHLLDHGDNGAGEWIDVDDRNSAFDTAGMGINESPWLGGGSFTWPIPVAWRVSDDDCATNVFCSTDQRFELDADGTSRVLKFNHVSERMTNGVFCVTGN